MQKKRPWYRLNRGQNKLWLEAHNYKWRISISEEVASELLFGLALKCPWRVKKRTPKKLKKMVVKKSGSKKTHKNRKKNGGHIPTNDLYLLLR